MEQYRLNICDLQFLQMANGEAGLEDTSVEFLPFMEKRW